MMWINKRDGSTNPRMRLLLWLDLVKSPSFVVSVAIHLESIDTCVNVFLI